MLLPNWDKSKKCLIAASPPVSFKDHASDTSTPLTFSRPL